MKFTEKLKAKKADKIENPAKETAKKEKKPLKQKIKDSMNKKYISYEEGSNLTVSRLL